MQDYREEFYRLYRTTHVEPRKGEVTQESHARRYTKWDRLIGPFVPADKSAVIVDCGCGNGQLVSWLLNRGYVNATGVDGSPEEVAVAAGLGLPVVEGELRKHLAARTQKLDFVILRNVIEHFHKPEIVEILRLTHASLRSDGRVFIQVPNAETPFGSRTRYADFTHEIAFTASSISQVLRVCSFQDIQVGAIRPAFRGWQGWLWRTTEWFYRTLLFAELRRKDFVLTQDLYAVAYARGNKSPSAE